MKIKALHIASFGGLKNTTLTFDNGFNVIYGDNENGKSTIMAFIKMMFYGNERNASAISKNPRKKYTPWDNSTMAGSIDFEKDNRLYRLEREFRKSNSTDKVTLVDLDLGTRQTVSSDIGIKLFGISEAAFERSVFISQFGFPESNTSAEGELNSKLSNMASTGDESVSFEEVKSNIEKLKFSLSSKSGRTGILDKNIKLKAELEERLNLSQNAYEEIQRLKEKVKLEITKQTTLQNKLNSVKFDLSRENDIKNAEKFKELLNLKAELDTLNESLTLSNGDIIDDMFVSKLKFCISKIEKYEQRFEILTSQTENIKNSLTNNSASNSKNLPEKEAEIKARIENLENERQITAKKRSETEEEYNLLLQGLNSLNTKKAVNLPLVLFSIILFSLAVLPIIIVPIKIGVIVIGVISLICSFVFKPKNKKAIEEQKEKINHLKDIAVNLKLKETELLANITAEKTNLSVISSALNSDTTVIEKQQALLKENSQQLNELKENIDTETYTLLNLYSVYSNALTVNEVLQGLEEITQKTERQKQLKQNINYIIKDVGNISYDEAKEKLNSLKNAINLNIDFENLKQESETLNQSIIESNATISSLNADIKMLTLKAENPETLKQNLQLLESKISEQTELLNCCEIALLALEESFIELRRSYGSELEKKAANIFSQITDNKYSNMNISKSFDISVHESDSFGGKEINYLSNGTIDQAYLSLRLALLELINENLPVLMDDALAQFDDNRTKTALEFLSDYSKETQVLLFTCHNAIASTANELGATKIIL